jgi:LPXTG-motif cell wall-anchored protein
MPARATRLLGALLMLLLAGGLASARADSAPPAPPAPAPATTAATTTPVTTTPAATPPPPSDTVAAPPPATTTPTTTAPPPPPAPPPAATGHVSATAAAPRARPRQVASHRVRAHAAAASSVTIRDFSFGPAAITVHAGDTVTWVNDGPTDHTATGSGFDTGTLSKGQSGSHTFASAGTFSYHCSLHPFMKGTVTVLAGTASAGATSGGTSAGTTATPPSAATTTTPVAGATLPRTGSDPPLLAVAGLIVLLAGLALRRTMRM